MANPATTLKKVTIKSVMGLTREADMKEFCKGLLKDKKEVEIVAVAGKVTGWGGKVNQFGESQFLIGRFFAINRQTGEQFKASKAYLPKDITENIIAAFDKRGDVNSAVEFSTTIKIVPDAAQGYTYICEGLETPDTINEDAHLLSKIASLPAPKLIENKKKA